MTSMRRLFPTLLAALTLAACGAESPSDVTLAFTEAFVANDMPTALTYLSGETLAVGSDQVAGMLQGGRNQMVRTGTSFEGATVRITSEKVDGEVAHVGYAVLQGSTEIVTETLVLMREADGWRISLGASAG